MSDKDSLSISLSAARLSAGYTQTDAAKFVGVSVNTVSSWESGRTDIPAKALFKLADMYNWPVDHIKL